MEVTIGRPPVYVHRDGREELLPIHQKYIESPQKRKIFVAHRRGRKTSITLEETFKYLAANPKIIGKTLAPKRKQAKEIIWDDPDMLFNQHICPQEIIADINRSDLKITLKNGSIYYLDGADNPHFQRGSNVKVLHLTEAGDHRESIWNEVYEPILTLNGGVGLFEGNPRGRNWYHKLFVRAQSREGWAAFLASVNDTPIFTKEELRDIEANNPANVYASEYLCEWVDSVGVVFRTFSDVAISTIQEARPGRKYRIGVDLAKIQDFTVLSIVDRHTWQQVNLDRFNHMDWPVQKRRIQEWAKKYGRKENGNEVELLIENNYNDSVIDDLIAWAEEEKDYDITIRSFRTTSQSKGLLVSNFSMLSDQGHIQILPDSNLLKEFEIFTYKKTANGFIYGAEEPDHDDCVMGTMLSYWDLGGKYPLPHEELRPRHSLIENILRGNGDDALSKSYLL